jgi:S-adenosylmethionine:tRNA ribosyltransferase-isomerase
VEEKKYKLSDFDYQLPEELIAQEPTFKRSDSRLMVLDRKDRSMRHLHFHDISQFLNPGDVLVFNDTKVFKARLFVRKLTGGKAEILFLKSLGASRWQVLMRGTGKFQVGQEFELEGARFKILKKETQKASPVFEIEVNTEGDLMKFLDRYGTVPLPPYIKRPAAEIDVAAYQTVYAKHPGAAAVPTAGLHFTQELIRGLETKGVRTAFITLHVGFGTFQPVKKEKLDEHEMHEEDYEITRETAFLINDAKERGNKVFACGTTAFRALESSLTPEGRIEPCKRSTSLFIYPPHSVRSADALITNFHLPKSTLLMLVSAFAGYDLIRQAYQEAIRREYRFFSYGDAMLIL